MQPFGLLDYAWSSTVYPDYLLSSMVKWYNMVHSSHVRKIVVFLFHIYNLHFQSCHLPTVSSEWALL